MAKKKSKKKRPRKKKAKKKAKKRTEAEVKKPEPSPAEKAEKAEKRLLSCGYLTKDSLAEAKRILEDDPDTIMFLGAMAITHHDSAWSDSQRDLYRGVTEILGRKCYWDKIANGGCER